MPSRLTGRVSDRVSCGRDFHCCPDINTALDTACKAGYDFCCLSIVNPRYKREFITGPATNRTGALTRSDLILTGQDWGSLIVGKISPWIQVDSKVDAVRKNSEKAFKEELHFASHLGLPAILIQAKDSNIANKSRIISEQLITGYFQQQYWIEIPLLSARDQRDRLIQGVDEQEVNPEFFEDTWDWWNKLYILCDCNKRLGVALHLTADIPDKHVIDRWLAEPIKAVIISTSLFLKNKKGYPVLSKSHQNLLQTLFKLDVQLIITGADRHPDKGIHAYQQYVNHLYQNQPAADSVAQFAKGYEDYLQSPLQPLMDNLESQTYEIFEKDPTKYTQYEKAVYYALLDRIPDEEKETQEAVIMVVGAGRGPLVRASLSAASRAGRKLKKVYAVEKNPNAVVTLENLRDEIWGTLVDVISCDMRKWEAPEKADILVSELLGSFGDNELSPECLDGAQRFLKDDGISIPCDYTSYLVPIQSPKLHNEVKCSKDKDKPHDSQFEMPYVVRLHNCQMLAEPQKVFLFHHPNRADVIDNSRHVSLDFEVPNKAMLHGFAGYFETTLYKDTKLSIVPESHSLGMFSWFPILFPIKTPVHLTAGCKVTVDMWRMVTTQNVWYEWGITSPAVLPIHNPKGRSYTIGL